jgi:hypothetical protein
MFKKYIINQLTDLSAWIGGCGDIFRDVFTDLCNNLFGAVPNF